jgi:hypothetical protein
MCSHRLQWFASRWFIGVVLGFLVWPLSAQGQPSGGPYGPLPQTYEVPKDAAHIYYVAPDGKADAPGTALDQPTTLEAAIEKVVTGDAIILRGGTYRVGGLKLNQGITMQPYADEQPVVKGTRVADKWQGFGNGLWRTSWSPLFPAKPQDWWRREREGKKTPLWLFNNDMVFVDGKALKAVGWEGDVDADSYYIDYDAGQVYIGVSPSGRLVEITAFDCALLRTTGNVHGKASDKKGPVIRGITFTQYAYRAFEIEGKRQAVTVNDEPTDDPVGPADPATFGKEVVGTTLENVTISHCSRVAGYFRGDHFTMRHCLVTDTSTEGVYLLASSDCLLEGNIFARNNVEQITGYFPSAVKIFNQTHRVVCRGNLVLDNPHSNGIWYDVGNVDGVFIDNWVQDCLDGFFVEISKGAICAGNVFVNCEHGIRVLNSSNVRCYHNTLVNTNASFERTNRSAVNDHFGWHPATGPDVDKREGHVFVGNLVAVDARFTRPLLRFDQMRVLCGKLTRPQVTQLDGNVYVRAGDAVSQNPFMWAPAAGDDCVAYARTLADFQKLAPGFETHSQSLNVPLRSIFKSPELARYELIRPLGDPAAGGLMPPEVRQLLGWPDEPHAPGAYAFRP